MARLHRIEISVADAPIILTVYHMSLDDIMSDEGKDYINRMLERRGLGGREFFARLPEHDIPKRTVPHFFSKRTAEAVDYVF